jgi:Xaa-Pro aminopeptidase
VLPPKERLSQKELERRYDIVRSKMKEKGLEVLLVSGIRFVVATGYLRYLTNWAEPFAGEVLVFPRVGAPTLLTRTVERSHVVKEFLGLHAVAGSTAADVAEVLEKIGYKQVGICGLKTMLAEFYVQLTAALPDVEFLDMSTILDEVRMVKSEEELGWIRKSANLTDVAFQVFASLVRAGRSESAAFVQVEHIVKELGAENTYFMMSADPKPVAKFLDMAFDTYELGDIVLFNAEVSGPGGYYTQLERTLSLGEPTKEAEDAYSVCLEALDKGTSLLLPGQKASDVYRTIVSAIENAGYKMGLHPGHSQGLDIFERPLIDAKEEIALDAGMVIVLHPHVLLPSGGGVWIGETFVITKDGPRPLQTSGREIKVIDEY